MRNIVLAILLIIPSVSFAGQKVVGNLQVTGLGGSGSVCVGTDNSGNLSTVSCGGALTPWTSDIDADNYDLNNVGYLEVLDGEHVEKTDNLLTTSSSNNTFNAEGGCDGSSFTTGDVVQTRVRSVFIIDGTNYGSTITSNTISHTFVGNQCFDAQFDADDYATVNGYVVEYNLNSAGWLLSSSTGLLNPAAGTISYHMENNGGDALYPTTFIQGIELGNYFDSITNRFYSAFSTGPAKFSTIYLDEPLPVTAGGTGQSDGTLHSGTISVDFYNYKLYGPSGISYDYGNGLIYPSNGSTAVVIDTVNQFLYNSGGTKKIDWNLGWFYDGAGNLRFLMNNNPEFVAHSTTDTVLKLAPSGAGYSGDLLEFRDNTDSANLAFFNNLAELTAPNITDTSLTASSLVLTDSSKRLVSSSALPNGVTATTQSANDNSTKVATTAYVDSAVSGQNYKEAVSVATTGTLVGIYSNGSSGVGATFTYTSTGVDAIDGVNLTLGIRVLLKNQTTSFQNGIYTVTLAGALGVAGVLTRSVDFDQSADIKTGDAVFITSGTSLLSTTWAYNGIDNPVMGTTAITFSQIGGSVPYLKISNTQASGSAGGTATSGSWLTATINTKDFDTSSIGTLTSNALSLPAGTYQVRGFMPFFQTQQSQARLYNSTDSASLITGNSGYASPSVGQYMSSLINGQFTIASTKSVIIQYQVNLTATTNGQGFPGGFGTEVFAQIEFWKIS